MTTALAADALRVRMYRVGFGDCFLLSVPSGAGHAHVLVDCGVHPAGDIGTLPPVVADIRQETGGEIALVVATHEHADHISGFGSFPREFAQVRAREIWMPWAMNPSHSEAAAMRRRRLALADELFRHFAAVGASAEARAVVANLRGNDKALVTLTSGFAGGPKVRYFGAGDKEEAPAGLPGVTVRVLGPPSDPKLLRKMEPPASERYLRMGRGRARIAVNGLEPFAAKWRGKPAATRKVLRFSQAEERAVRAALTGSLENIAFALDSFVNNTSLVLLFSVRGQHLLFPGDAQYGNWKGWLDADDAAAVLDQVSFLKVAHHGSYNATPKRALEGMRTRAFTAMVSTQRVPWKSIPQPALMTRLQAKTGNAIFRSDAIRVTGAPSVDVGTGRRFTRGPYWADWVVKLGPA